MGFSSRGRQPGEPARVILMPSQEYDEYEGEAAMAYAKAVNNLDCSMLKPMLAKEAVYESQHVLNAISGPSKILKYLKAKFITIGEAVWEMRVRAEMAWMNSTYTGRPAVILHQGEQAVAVVLFKTESGRITRIDICGVLPRVDEATGTGEFPT